MRSSLPAVTLALAALLSAPRAQACWDGYHAVVGNVSISVSVGQEATGEWVPSTIREVALWGSRIDALLPPETRLEVGLGNFTFCATLPTGECSAGLTELPWSDDDELPTLFGKTTTLTHADAAAIRRAMALTVLPLTVQVFASKSERRADALATAIDAAGAGDHGFLEAGGFPAFNPTAHVVAGKDAAGHPIHRVFVGAFLSRADAAAAAAKMRKTLRIKGFIRPL